MLRFPITDQPTTDFLLVSRTDESGRLLAQVSGPSARQTSVRSTNPDFGLRALVF
jgi:hypothetical protein